MSLRQKILLLLIVFAAFALIASFATIYGIQVHIDGATVGFQRSLDQMNQVERLRVDAREQFVRLRDVVSGSRPADDGDRVQREEFLTRLAELARFAPPREESFPWEAIGRLGDALRDSLAGCAALAADGQHDRAEALRTGRIEGELAPALYAQLNFARARLDESRQRSLDALAATHTQMLVLALLIGLFGAGLVGTGAALIRRRLMLPISALQRATQEFGQGNLGYRVALPADDELGRLGAALNHMAVSLAEAQRRVRRTEAMEATVTLARGIAHDFNNLLTSATGTLSLLGSEITDPRQRERVRRALRACWQAAGLSKKLLEFARGDHGHPQVFCLRETVELILQSMDESFLEGIRIHKRWDSSAVVKMDRDQLTQVVLNLIRNAREAMPEGGDLRITISSVTKNAATPDSSPAPWAILTVADSGLGMSADVKKRIFEPFFTTKARTAGRGRGMGLAIVYAAVQNAGGHIEVDSRPGAGTAFRVYLPASEGPPAALEPPRYFAPLARGRGTVLLVDDDPMVLAMCREAFEKWGYSVVAASGAADARGRFAEAQQADVSLAVIDMDLVDGAGIDLARALVEQRPELRIIFTTGGSDDQTPSELEEQVCARLTKPFRLDALATTVSAALAPVEPCS